ncbi:MAG: hypothetical protein EOO59_21715, partial [Hymenobacter sp.]
MQTVDFASQTDLGQARQHLRGVGRHYAGRYVAAVLLPILAACLFLAVLAQRWPGAALPLELAALGVGLVAGWRLWQLRHLGSATVARRLDRQFPELEDSTGLLLQASDNLNLLGQLQQERVAQQLRQLTTNGAGLLPLSFNLSLLTTAALALSAAAMWFAPASHDAAVPASVAVHFTPDPTQKPTAAGPARITNVRLLVTPPAYTRRRHE